MIHPTAVIDRGAEIGPGVEIAPYTVIDADVTIGANCRIGPHVHIAAHTTIGPGTAVHAGAVIGDEPQDLHFDGSDSYTVVGANCTLREYVTIHRGSSPGSITRVGDNVMLMAFTHLGHNCQLGDNIVIANNCMLAGHVQVEPRAFISGGVALHQFCRVGTLAMVGGMNRVVQDVPPYCMLQDMHIQGPNTVGLRRAGLAADVRQAIRGAIKLYFFAGLNRPNALEAIRERYGNRPEVTHFADFIATTGRGIVSGRGGDGDDDDDA